MIYGKNPLQRLLRSCVRSSSVYPGQYMYDDNDYEKTKDKYKGSMLRGPSFNFCSYLFDTIMPHTKIFQMKPNQYKGRPLLNSICSVFSLLSLLCMNEQFQNMSLTLRVHCFFLCCVYLWSASECLDLNAFPQISQGIEMPVM